MSAAEERAQARFFMGTKVAGAFGFSRRVVLSIAIDLFAWLQVSVPYWNWYRFPADFTVGNLLEVVLGWALAGAAMAWWLGRRPA